MAECASANFLYARWQEHSARLLRVVIQTDKGCKTVLLKCILLLTVREAEY